MDGGIQQVHELESVKFLKYQFSQIDLYQCNPSQCLRQMSYGNSLANSKIYVNRKKKTKNKITRHLEVQNEAIHTTVYQE